MGNLKIQRALDLQEATGNDIGQKNPFNLPQINPLILQNKYQRQLTSYPQRWGRGWGFPPSPPSAMHAVAGSRTWSDSSNATGPGAMIPSDLFSGSDSSIAAGRSAVTTGKSIMLVAVGGGWLVSGGVFRVGLVTVSSSAGPMV